MQIRIETPEGRSVGHSVKISSEATGEEINVRNAQIDIKVNDVITATLEVYPSKLDISATVVGFALPAEFLDIPCYINGMEYKLMPVASDLTFATLTPDELFNMTGDQLYGLK